MFKIINNNYKYLIIFVVFNLLFVGCSKKEEHNTTEKSDNNNKSTAKIEIVTNTNAKEIKVKTNHNSNKDQSKSFYYDYNINSEYSQDAQPANKDASVRMKPRTVLDAYSHIRSPYERVQVSLIAKQLSSTFKLKCSACHDDYANGVLGPSLLGRDSNYIYKKIIDFKTGVKSNPLMTDLIKAMSDKEIHKIANEIYEFNKRVQKLRGKQ